jgi:hypothetical protein
MSDDLQADVLDALRAFCGDHEATGFECAGLNTAYQHAKAVLARVDGSGVIVSCSWCHTGVALLRHGATYCPTCGHRADVARAACTCPQCVKRP